MISPYGARRTVTKLGAPHEARVKAAKVVPGARFTPA
jgi:hypothetical protein